MTKDKIAFGNTTRVRHGGKSASICVREFDVEWTITRVNTAHCDLFDCASGDLIGRKAWSFMDGNFAQEEQKRFLTLLLKERRRPAPFCCTERLGDGSLLPIRVDWCYRHDQAGEVIGFIWWLEPLDTGTNWEIVPGGEPYKELLDALHDGVGLVHRNGSFTYVNRRLCEILGVDKQALVGRSIFSLGDECGKQALASARAAGARSEIDRCDVTYRHSNGKRLRLLVSGRSLKSQIGSTDPGRDVTSLMIVTDVTHGWRAETMRRRQAQIFGEIQDAILVLNRARVIVDCSASAERLFGYEKGELIGKPAYNLQSPHARPVQEPEIAVALAEHGRWAGEIQVSQPVGSDRICDVTIGPFRDGDGQVIGYISVSRDVTAKKAAERALSDSEERYRQLVEMQSDALLVHDQTGEIAFANNAAAELYRAGSVKSLRQKNWLELLPQERREAATKQAEAIRELGYKPPCYESSHRRLDGTPVSVELSARRVSWDGHPAVMSIIRDITDRKQAEDALRASESRFRSLLREQKIAHVDLRAAKEKAVRANLAKSRFLASASHDLRQPLHASNLFLAALADAQNKEERDQIIGDLGTALLSMGGLLHDLLEISKLEAQVVQPEIADFYLRGLMSRLATEFGVLANQKGIELRLVTSDVTVRSDLAMLGRILSNFLANAVQHTDRGKILFGCRRVGSCVRIAVWDTGRGIPVEAQDIIFEEFYQHGVSSRERNSGLGLGLAIVRRTASLLGHQISMVSEPGKGSMFAVDVPAGSVEGQAVDAKRWSMAVNGDVAGTSMVVLEDDTNVRKATEQVLTGWGVSVIAVDTSDAALAAISRSGVRPDLLIADYQLLDETGLTAAQRIRDACGGDIPTIVITGDPTAARLAEIAQAGATAMNKPVKPAELRLAIREMSRCQK